MGLVQKVKSGVQTAKKYWSVPPKGKYIPYKEIACLSGAGFGVDWLIMLASTISLNASNFLVGASIGLRPADLQTMLVAANIVGIPMGIFRGWYYDNHRLPGGKFLPFIKKTALPIALISILFVWLPYEQFSYNTKAVVVWFIYLILNIFLSFYNESYMYFQQIISPDSQERANAMSISQVIYSLAPTITNALIPTVAGLTWGLDNIKTYRIIYPVFTIIGLVISTIFFRKVKERLILPKKKPEPIRMIDALREVSKNKYFWIIQAAAWVVFLESGYGVVLGWSFQYAYGGEYREMLGIANTIIGNAALWSMLLAPIAIKVMGKRNMLITANALNVLVLIVLYFTFNNLIVICVLWYFNTFINTFWNIVQHNISADMRDYHQWKTGVRVDGLFGPLGIIGTFIGFFTGYFYPVVYEKMGLLEDYSVLYNDAMRNSLFKVLIVCSIFGALFNLIPFCFYDLTENKHRAYVDVLKIRAMFENHSLGVLEDEELEAGMNAILEARAHYGKSKRTVLNASSRAEKKQIKEYNLAIERADIVMKDLKKFGTKAGKARIDAAFKTCLNGVLYSYEEAGEELKEAKRLPKSTAEEKEIRADAIKLAKVKMEATSLIKKYGAENIIKPDYTVKEEIQNREAASFSESMKIRQELRAFAKAESIYARATKPYWDAKNLITQSEDYSNFKKLKKMYFDMQALK